jgi:hypothetical protein
MSDGLTIFLTAVATLIVGVIERRLVEPNQDLRRKLAGVEGVLSDYGNIYANPLKDQSEPEEYKEARKKTRGMASDLRQTMRVIICYSILQKLHLVMDRDDIKKICENLIGLSNSLIGDDIHHLLNANQERLNEIRTILDKIK